MPGHISYMTHQNDRDVHNQCNLLNVQVNGFHRIWFNAFFAHKFIGKAKDFRVYFPPPNCQQPRRGTLQRDLTPLPGTRDENIINEQIIVLDNL